MTPEIRKYSHVLFVVGIEIALKVDWRKFQCETEDAELFPQFLFSLPIGVVTMFITNLSVMLCQLEWSTTTYNTRCHYHFIPFSVTRYL